MRVKKRFFCLVILFIVIAFFAEKSDALTVGNISLTNDSICSGTSFQLVLLNYSSLNDSIYWQKKINGNWISINGSTNDTIVQSITVNTFFRAVVDSSGILFYSDSVLVSVKAVPHAFSTNSLQTKCSNIPIDTIKLTTNPYLSGTTFTWTRSNTNYITGTNSGSQAKIIETFRNKTNVLQTTFIHIVPIYNGCIGDTLIDTIRVKPEPVAISTNSLQTKCSNIPIDTIKLTTNPYLSGTTFTWTRSNTNYITGTNSGSQAKIIETFRNKTNVLQTTFIHIVPTYNGCKGDTLIDTIRVKPEPVAISTNSLQTKCSNISIDTIKFTTNPYLSGTTFTWTRSNTNYITGTNSGSQAKIIETFRNKTNVLQTTFIHIVPTYNGCKGDTLKDTIIVKPEPVPFLNITSQNVCNGMQIDTIFIDNQLQSTNFNWFRDNLQYLSGLEIGTDSIISGILTVNNNSNQNTVFKIISENNNCYGDTVLAYVNVKVLPAPNKISGDSLVCKNQTLLYKALIFTSNAYHWKITGGKMIYSNYPDSTEVQITWDSILSNQHQLIMREGLIACSVTDTINVYLKNAKAPLPDSLIKMNNLNMLVCSKYINMPANSFTYNWGYTDKNNPLNKYYINDFQNKSYCIFPHLHTNLNYYWVRTSFNDTTCDTYTYFMNEVPLYTDEVKKSEIIDFNIYPNPCFDEFCISFNQEMKGDYKLKIYDMMGKLLFSNILNCENRNFAKKINIKELKNAIYLICIELGNGAVIWKKIIKG